MNKKGCLQVSQVILDRSPAVPSYKGMSCVDGMGKPLDRTKAGGFFVRVTDQLDLRISLNQPEKKGKLPSQVKEACSGAVFYFQGTLMIVDAFFGIFG